MGGFFGGGVVRGFFVVVACLVVFGFFWFWVVGFVFRADCLGVGWVFWCVVWWLVRVCGFFFVVVCVFCFGGAFGIFLLRTVGFVCVFLFGAVVVFVVLAVGGSALGFVLFVGVCVFFFGGAAVWGFWGGWVGVVCVF